MIDKIKILIVEDESLLAIGIKTKLVKMGYKMVNIAINYEKAMLNIKEETPDSILLDVDLKGTFTGIDIANTKEVFNKIPIIYITSYKDSKTLEKIMLTNPKNYLSKSLRYEELKVAVSLALKDKMIKTVDMGYGFNYDFESRELFVNKVVVNLTKKEKLLLESLLKRKGEYVSSSILEFEIWLHEVPAESSLRTLVVNLRKKLKYTDEPIEKHKMLLNKPSLGYMLTYRNIS